MKQPSFLKVVRTDYWCFLLFLVTVSCTIFFFFGLTIPIALLSGYFLIKRTQMIRDVFGNGVAVPGLITKKRFTRGEWLLCYRYSYNGIVYERGNYILKLWIKLRKGEPAEVYINPAQPMQAFLSEFYLKN
ncbi:hypothetical protein H6G76_02105 [Nostoc sp. FACHB-152]|uniref:DUF3592 domain-containing protein n=1 Tax=unclassified Nostoc TaxID=2593658 RepID=UPI001689B220|nr:MULTISPECIES: hypothetical protein [unclassified Nostoc]MBD2445965.1 hypothetical protein [Nostoc sp. FACHB-152]MBD2467196.1 hypothetical protein [Nostoc sp. FACHB-145]